VYIRLFIIWYRLITCFIIYAASIVCGVGSMQWSGVHLSVCPVDWQQQRYATGFLLIAGMSWLIAAGATYKLSIDTCRHVCLAANVGCIMWRAEGWSSTQTCFFQLLCWWLVNTLYWPRHINVLVGFVSKHCFDIMTTWRCCVEFYNFAAFVKVILVNVTVYSLSFN